MDGVVWKINFNVYCSTTIVGMRSVIKLVARDVNATERVTNFLNKKNVKIVVRRNNGYELIIFFFKKSQFHESIRWVLLELFIIGYVKLCSKIVKFI